MSGYEDDRRGIGENRVVFYPFFDRWLEQGQAEQAREAERRQRFANRSAELTAAVVAEIQRVAVGGIAPILPAFRQMSNAPIRAAMNRGYSWGDLVRMAGCEMQPRGKRPEREGEYEMV